MKTSLAAVLVAWFLAGIAMAAETGIAARDLDLLAEPRNDARVIGKLPKNGKFELLKSERFWVQVSTGTHQGWVLAFYLSMREAPPASPSPGRVVAESLGLATQRQGGQATAALGIRGIDEEGLKAAQFNAEELKKLESFLVTGPAAASFAQEVNLAPKKVEYLSAPSPENQSGREAGGQ